ncbi:MAG: class I SAM-dependent methyltransferase [Oscillatoriales cyanobacterium]|nr:MAG: class I SAM-dependent methyltransferase [Oscillatoriales cyanobacterium]
MSPFFHADWSRYYAAVAIQPPRHTLIRTLTLFDREQRQSARSFSPTQSRAETPGRNRAADLGCGTGRDTLLLLERGWHVLAIDAEIQAITALQEQIRDRDNPQLADQLSTQCCAFEAIQWPPSLQLVNASFSLPFCPPDRFGAVWQAIRQTLQAGGWFCGQFFGDRDEWSAYTDVTNVSRSDLMALFQGATIVELEEEEYDGQTATGSPKHWHIFHVILQFPMPRLPSARDCPELNG